MYFVDFNIFFSIMHISQTKIISVTILITLLVLYSVISSEVLTRLTFVSQQAQADEATTELQLVLLKEKNNHDNDQRYTTTTATPFSYNLCPVYHRRRRQGMAADEPFLPSLVYRQYVDRTLSRVIRSDQIRVYIQESYYNALQGTFHFLITPFSADKDERGEGDDYWSFYGKLAPHMSVLATHLFCWDSITQMVTPVAKNYENKHSHGEVLCPFILFPHQPHASDQHITFLLLVDYLGPEHEPVTLTKVRLYSAFVSTNISVCIYQRPVVDNSWCSNGLQGTNMETRLREFVLYHHAIGIDRFMFFDDHHQYEKTFQPFVDAGIVDYVHSPPYFPHMPQGYMQDTLTAICRSRYLTSTKWIGFFDIDEFVVFNQVSDDAYNSSVLSPVVEQATQVIPPIPERDPSVIPSMLTSAIQAIQNLKTNRQYQAVGITLAECMPLEDKNPKSSSLTERFTECNRNHHERVSIDIIRSTIQRMEKLLPLQHPVRNVVK
jgi:hypothetical protein